MKAGMIDHSYQPKYWCCFWCFYKLDYWLTEISLIHYYILFSIVLLIQNQQYEISLVLSSWSPWLIPRKLFLYLVIKSVCSQTIPYPDSPWIQPLLSPKVTKLPVNPKPSVKNITLRFSAVLLMITINI